MKTNFNENITLDELLIEQLRYVEDDIIANKDILNSQIKNLKKLLKVRGGKK